MITIVYTSFLPIETVMREYRIKYPNAIKRNNCLYNGEDSYYFYNRYNFIKSLGLQADVLEFSCELYPEDNEAIATLQDRIRPIRK